VIFKVSSTIFVARHSNSNAEAKVVLAWGKAQPLLGQWVSVVGRLFSRRWR
jgi:hypothetical protein